MHFTASLRIILASLIAFIALSVSSVASAMWVTNGPQVGPNSGVIIADTGAIGGGSSWYTFVAVASANSRIVIAVRDETNTSDVVVQNLFVPANGNLYISMPIDVPPGGRVIMRMGANTTATVQGSILKDGPA